MDKKLFLQEIGNGLFSFGYRTAEPSPQNGIKLFYKPINDLFLTLGIESSKFYKGKFSGSFYLSKNLTWSYMPPSFPREAYKRISSFLDDSERMILLSSEYTEPGVVDAWWNYNTENISNFSRTIQLTEPRFLAQDNLLKKISNCPDTEEIRTIVKTFQAANTVPNSLKQCTQWVEGFLNDNTALSIWNNKQGIQFLSEEIHRQSQTTAAPL